MGERIELAEALEVVASGGATLDLTDLEALRVIVHFAIDHMDCRRVLSVPTEQMVEAAAKAYEDTLPDGSRHHESSDAGWEWFQEHHPDSWAHMLLQARAALTAAFASTTEEET
jgi:hypothetical protein